jgi:hypothetical protein
MLFALFPACVRLGVRGSCVRARVTGIDIVGTQIDQHQARYAKQGVRSFAIADLASSSPVPAERDGRQHVTLILCRQALQHLNAHSALRVLHQFSRSGASYLLTTTYSLKGYRQEPGFAVQGDSWLADENYTPRLPGADSILMDLTRPPFSLAPMLASHVENDNQYIGPASGGPRPRECVKGHLERLGLWALPLQARCATQDPVDAARPRLPPRATRASTCGPVGARIR